MFNTGRFSDVKIICEKREIKAHKIILAEQSTVFNERLLATNTNTLEINDLDYDTTFQILNFIYKDKIDHLDSNIENIIAASEKVGTYGA